MDAVNYLNRGRVEPQVVVIDVQHQRMKNFNYLLVDAATRQAVIVDPAWQVDKIIDTVRRQRCDLAGVLVTHSHPDHIDLAAEISDRFACPIWMSAEEIHYSGYSAPFLKPVHGASWKVGNMVIEPVFTPGHTPGCLCYKIGDNLFTGDVLFAEGCGVCPDHRAARQMYVSLQRIIARVTHKTRIYPGHSYGKPPGRTFEEVKAANLYLHFEDEESFANYRLRSQERLMSRILEFQ